ncbi:MAG TPA: fibronectin type III domain-containing protein, partial [Kofleriaceae bacterium]|nr:fibronectin type III domain-containing protein [Kofleriaceae bacterium]
MTRTSWMTLALAVSTAAACATPPEDADELGASDAELAQAAGVSPAGLAAAAVASPATITSLVSTPSAMRLSFVTNDLSLASVRLLRMDRLDGYYARYATLTVNAKGSYVYDDTAAVLGHEYCYIVVTALAGQTSGTNSVAACGFHGAAPPPSPPTGFTLDGSGERSMAFHFTDASSDETSFVVERAGVGTWLPVYTLTSSAGTGAVRSFGVEDLDSELGYCFRVRAVNANGSSAAPVSCGTTKAALSWDPAATIYQPEIITITHPAPGQLQVQWIDLGSPSTWEVEGYDGLLGAKLLTANVQDHRVPRPQKQAATLSSLQAGRLYCFQINRLGNRSRKVCESPRATRTADDQREPRPEAAPQLTAVSPASNTQLQLSISNPQPGQMVERIPATTGARTTFLQSTAGAGTYVDVGLTPGQTTCYRLWVFNQFGSRYDNVRCGTTTTVAPGAPSNLRVTSKVGREVTVSWDPGLNASSYTVHYRGTRPAYVAHDVSSTTSGLSFHFTGFDQFTYWVEVTAKNAYGSSSTIRLDGIAIDNGGVISYGTALSQVDGTTTFSHRVAPGAGAAYLTSVAVAGNAFTPYVVRFIPGGSCETLPSGGISVEPGQVLTGAGLATLYGSSEPATPLTLVACKMRRAPGGETLDSMPIQ